MDEGIETTYISKEKDQKQYPLGVRTYYFLHQKIKKI